MRTRENFLAYTACRKVHQVSARRWPYTMGVFRRAARAISGYDGINRQDRDEPVQAPILRGAYENCPCLENPSLRPCALVCPACLGALERAEPGMPSPNTTGKFGQQEAAATGRPRWRDEAFILMLIAAHTAPHPARHALQSEWFRAR